MSPAGSIASERGLALGDDELERVRSTIRRPGRSGPPRRTVSSPGPDRGARPGFTPVEFDPGSGLVEWVDMRGVEVDRPFYEEVVRSALAEPFRLLFRARTRRLSSTAPDPGDPALRRQLAGLIFHTSRCGSTLVCRMLAQVPGTVVISEPAIVDQLLRAPGDPGSDPRAVGGRGRRRAHRARARSRNGRCSSSTRGRRAASGCCAPPSPDTPWVFLHREPAEVVASQLRAPGMTCAPGMLPAQLFDLDPERGAPDALRAILRDCDRHDPRPTRSDNSMRPSCLLGYEELPDAVFTRILPHFGIEAGAEAREAMTGARRPRCQAAAIQRFDPDAAAQPTAAVREACRRYADEPYAALRALAGTDAVQGGAPW